MMIRKLLLTIAIVLACCLGIAGQAVAAPGHLDSSFGQTGTVPIEPPPNALHGWAADEAAAGPNGSIYVYETAFDCTTNPSPSACQHQGFVSRYRANGQRDLSFGGSD